MSMYVCIYNVCYIRHASSATVSKASTIQCTCMRTLVRCHNIMLKNIAHITP